MFQSKLIYHRFFFVGILVFLFVPLLQNTFYFKWIQPLKGAYQHIDDIGLTKDNWLEGAYQLRKEEYLDNTFGFRNYYVRLNNQINLSLFRKSNVKKVVVGKGGFLYEDDYINAYYGNNFVGKEKLGERFNKLKIVQNLLLDQGILLEVVFAPGKASFYPEFIPDNWRSEKKLSNYQYCRKLCDEMGIDYIDFNAWFLKEKGISPYDLYPKTGIHWSNYGALLAIDSLKSHIEKRTKMKLREFVIDNVSFSDSLLSPDNDIGESMNLVYDIPVLPMPYANYHWIENENAMKPSALFIGDSYFWNIYYQGFTNNFFTDCKFWYYNKTIYPESVPEREVKKLDLRKELSGYKVVVLMATESNIHDIGWGFIENVYEIFKQEIKSAFRKSVYLKDLVREIHSSPGYMSEIKKKATANNIPFETQIQMDAEYIYRRDFSSAEIVTLTEKNKERIRNTPEWMGQIKKKAKEKNMTEDEMIELDAKYIYVTEQRDKLQN